MVATYVAMPFIATAVFFAPALTAMVAIARESALMAIILGALWLLFLILMLRDNPDLTPVLAGLATWLLSGAIGGWVATRAGWSAPLGQMAVILTVMGLLAGFNTVRIRRDRGKPSAPSARRSLT